MHIRFRVFVLCSLYYLVPFQYQRDVCQHKTVVKSFDYHYRISTLIRQRFYIEKKPCAFMWTLCTSVKVTSAALRKSYGSPSVNEVTPKDMGIWWRHQMETFSALLAFLMGNSPVTGEFPTQRPVTWSFDVFFDLRLNQSLSKQWRRRWFETSSRSLWHHCDDWHWT